MSFYGNVTDTSRTHFQFDKIFSNRTEMDKALVTGQDRIFAGRFVLVKYTSNDGTFRGDLLSGYMGTNGNIYLDIDRTVPYQYASFTRVETPVAADWDQYYYVIDNFFFKLPSQEYFNENENNYYTTTATGNNIVTNNQVVRLRDEEGVPTNQFYKCTGGTGTVPTWELIIFEAEYSDYFINYNIDQATYGESFDERGYDATVWQKIYSEGLGKFILIAHLNSVSPSIELFPEPPSMQPVAPYLDSKSTDSHYRIHVPTHWGLQIKEETDASKSDQQIIQTKYQYNSSTGNYEPYQTSQIDAAIYFNKAGADPLHRSVDTDTLDEIKLEPTGESGKIYYDADGNEVSVDTLELTIHTPAVGNMIAHGYDLIYGNSAIRPMDVKWYDGDQATLIAEGDQSLGGKTFNLETLAGTLNTMHNRLGQIIIDLPNFPSDETGLAALDDKYIYHYNGRYYRKGISYHYYDPEDLFQYVADNNVTADNYISNTYYINVNDTYVPSTSGYESGTTYYKKYIQGVRYSEVEGGLQEYVPGQYFTKVGTDYIRDNNPITPTYLNATYYIVDETEGNRVSHGVGYFSGQYEPGIYFTAASNGDYLVARENSPDPLKEYLLVNSQSYGGTTNVVLYQPGLFYYKISDGSYQRSDYPTRAEAIAAGITQFYWLEFEDTPVFSSYYDEHGDLQTRLSYPLKEAHAVAVQAEYPTDPNALYYMENGNFLAFKNLTSVEPSQDGTPAYAIARRYYTLTDVTPQVLYVPGKYYVLTPNQEGVGSYYLSYENFDMNRIYYELNRIITVTRNFYLPDTYYYKVTENPEEYALDSSETYTNNRIYYTKIRLFVTADTSPSHTCPYGYEWNDAVKFVPASITLQGRIENKTLIELEGFENGISSINGYFLQMDKYLAPNDQDVRDSKTLRGSLNILSDYLYGIGKLTPGKILYVNDFGQITSSSIDYQQLLNLLS